MHKFFAESERDLWPTDIEYMVDSLSLPGLFARYKIRGRYIIKVDCEGGERFLLGDEQAIDIVKGCVQFNIELHRFGGTVEQWNEWFKFFETTHVLYTRTQEKDDQMQTIYKEIHSPSSNNMREYMLVRRDYVKPTDG